MLAYALPLKSLLITGRKSPCFTELTPAEVAETIHDGRWDWWNGQERYYDGLSGKELAPGLTSWSPTVRRRSALSISTKDNIKISTLIGLLDDPRKETRYGACTLLRYMGTKADPAATRLIELLDSDDPWMRALSAEALVGMSHEIRVAAVPALLKAIQREGCPL